jgi:hypothetical protein
VPRSASGPTGALPRSGESATVQVSCVAALVIPPDGSDPQTATGVELRMSDVAFVAVTIVVFGLLALIARGVERL